MNTTVKNYTLALIAIVFLSVSNSKAATYTTMANGAYTDVVSVWSTDGGASPCFCAPPNPTALNTVIINHDITIGANLVINGSIFTINATGSLASTNNLNTWNSTINISGPVNISKYVQGVGSTVNFNTGAVIIASNSFDVENGTLTMDGSVANSGGLDIHAGGTMILMNSARYFVVSGNATNRGLLDIGPASCMSSNGNWRNMAMGTVTGSGAINSGGNLQNSGTFSATVSWCANGTGLGLPTAEDCATAGGICAAITLPVELTNFTAEAEELNYIQLEWTTLSETNSDYFAMMSSTDGQVWKQIGTVSAAGNSNETIDYSFEDYNVRYGVTYYKLVQYDFNQDSYDSDVISLKIEGSEVEIGVFPNPIRNGETLTVSNLEESEGDIKLYNMSGQLIETARIDGMQSSAQISIANLQPGIYLVNVEQLGHVKTKRLVITE